MSTYLKANNTETLCEAAEHYRDSAWGRPTCTVTIKASAAEIAALLPSNAPWSLIEREAVTMERAAELRPVIEAAAVSLSDGEAAKSPELITRWADHIGETVAPGDRRSDEDESGVLRVYKVREGQGHTTQADWPPHKTPALWTIIDLEHAGTQDDPIPAARGMEYTYGLYYKDPEDTKLYLCERTGEQSGNKITLQYLPHELAGSYFKAVSA